MRTSIASLSKKLISTFFAATLALGLVPAAAFAAPEDATIAANEATEEESSQDVIPSEVGEADAVEESAPIGQNEAEGLATSSGENEAVDEDTGSNLSIPAALERINEDVALTQPVAQQESTRNYFLAQTLESTKTVPIVSANLPLDKGMTDQVVEPDAEGDGDNATEDEGGEDSDESDLPTSTVIAADSTVIGSFTYEGMTFAIEAGDESVALVAVDYAQLPEQFVQMQIIVIPEAVTADGIDYYSVTRVADNAFSSLTKENAKPDYKGCVSLFTNEELLAAAGIDAAEADTFLNPESDMVDIDSDGEMDTFANPLKDCMGILVIGIPASAISIGNDAFAGFDTLQYIVVEDNNPTYASYDGALYSADLTNLRLIPEGRVGTIRVAPSATTVDPEAFSHCPSVDTVVADPEGGILEELKSKSLYWGDNNDLVFIDSDVVDAYALEPGLVAMLCRGLASILNVVPVEEPIGFVGGQRSAYAATGGDYDTTEPGDRVIANGGLITSHGRFNNGYEEQTATSFTRSGYLKKGTSTYVHKWYFNYGNDNRSFRRESTVTTDASTDLDEKFYVHSRPGYTFLGWSKNAQYAENRSKIRTTSDPHSVQGGNDWYAQWDVPVTWNGNGGTFAGGLSSSTTLHLNGSKDIKFSETGLTVTRAGYNLVGWADTPTSTSTIDKIEIGNTAREVYAVWQAELYTITWHMNNESATAPTKATYTYGETYTLPAVSTYKNKGNKDLVGWYTNSGCTTSISSITSTTSGNLDIYAKWTAATYTITWYMNNTSATAPAKTTYTYGETYTLPGVSTYKDKDKKDLVGWYSNSACTAPASSITNTTSGNLTFYAKWTAATYTITYNMNGHGTAPTSPTSWTYGTATALPNPTEVTGYTWGGWFKEASCTNSASVTDTTSGNLVVYAKWTAKTYTIAWNTNGHGTAPDKTSYTFGESYTLPVLSETGFAWGGWFIDSDLVLSASNITATTSGNLTFYAKWTAATYTITWHMNNTSATAPTKTTYTYGETYTLPALSDYKDKDHKDLEGWYTDEACTIKASGITSNVSGDLTFYAKWKAATYTITWNMNNGSAAAPSKTTYTYGSTYTLPALTDYKDKDHKDLEGWYTNSNCTTNASNITTTTSGNLTFYAKWNAATYTITWVMNSSSASAPAKTTYTYGSTYTLPALSDYKDKGNKDLEGWYTNEALTTKASDITTATSGNKTFYAKWNAATYTITWVMNNSSASAPAKTTYTYGSTYTLPALSDYKDKGNKDLEGWYTNEALTTKASNITATTSGNKTFYAKWNAATYTITWDMKDHGEDQKPAKTSYSYGDTYTLPPIDDVTGWDFKGWCSDSACATSASDISATTSGSKTFYAKWERAQYKITYIMKGHGTAPTSPTGWTYGYPPTLQDPAKVGGWTFGGWYTDENTTDGKQANITATSASDVTLYAKWTVNKHTVFWKFNGADDKTDYKVENVEFEADVFMVNPGKKDGWKFAGWQASGADTSPYGYGNNEKMSMPDGDVTLTAQWTKLDRIAVNLADKHLGEATGKFWYWPEKGYVTEEDPTFTVEVGSVIATPPSVLGYQFLGWYATEDQNDNENPMIDSEGKLRTTSSISSVTTWYAHWKWVSCPVNLLAEYDGIPYVTSAGDPTSIPFARFGVALNECLEGGKLKSLPERTGYTFMGYYTKANPEMSKADAEDETKFKGTQWIDKNGNLSTNKWNEYPMDKRGKITLYAAWRLDECEVTFDATGNVNGVEFDKEQVAIVSAPSNVTWYYGKPKTLMAVASESTFYRNGYEFGGWYYLKDTNGSDVESNRRFVSDAKGNPTPANWDVVKTSVTLYPFWTAKEYTLWLGYNYPPIPGEELGLEDFESMKVVYDEPLDLSKFTPSYDPYTFKGWYTDTEQFFEETHMTESSDGTKRFTPRGSYAAMSEIDLHAHWSEPGKYQYTLMWKFPGTDEIVESVHDYYFTDTVKFDGTEAPTPVPSGYRFEGWVEMPYYKDAHDALAGSEPYMEGDTTDGWKPMSMRDRFFVAKWNTRAFSVSFSTTPRETTESGESWIRNTDLLENWSGTTDALSWEEACKRANQAGSDMSTGITYDITMPSFVLPDVKRKGQVFEGWKLLDAEGNPTGTAMRGIVVDPSTQDAQGMRDLVYMPVFKDALYTIILDANTFGEEQRFENIPYSDEFTFPYPATLSTGSVFKCWGEDSNTVSNGTEKFYPMQTVKLAPTYNEVGEMTAFGLAHLANDDNEIRLYAVWNNAEYHVDVPLFANLAIDTDRGDVIAGTNTIAPDPENADSDAIYRIESIRYEPLKNDEGVYAFQREGMPSDKVYLSVYAGLNTGEATDLEHLLYADKVDAATAEVTYTDADDNIATAKPLLIELGGTTPVVYGRTAAEGQPSLAGVTDADAPYGFVTFSAKNPLTIRYGLFFENDQTRKDFAFGSTKYDWLLPKNDGANQMTEQVDTEDPNYGRRIAWSGNTVDVAKLHYTVSLVK